MKRREFVRGLAVAGASSVLHPIAQLPGFTPQPGGRTIRLDDGWRFHLGDVSGAERIGLDVSGWERVSLPHAARIEALVTGEPGSPTAQWQGICWYRQLLELPNDAAGRTVLLRFEGAMNDADVWVDGVHVARHAGGFLPFVVDISARAAGNARIVLAMRLDNRDDPITGPKPLRLLDFNMYHGLYRYVHLVVKDRLHITDPILANRPASGGVFITTPQLSAHSATVRVQTHVRNGHPTPRSVRVRSTILMPDGTTVASALSAPRTLQADADADIVQEITVRSPRLWSPRAPNLYVVRTEIVHEGVVTDVEHTRIGIRRIEIDRDGFRINGERIYLRGTNRHQEHPYVGFAVPEDAQYRDARRIKDAGFDYIRLSHYPHAPAFMDACDELGLVVMDSIPGWQYFGADPEFTELQYRNCRDLVRRDRNHPSVVMWEVSLNETAMPAEFIARTHAMAHEEYPGDQCYTCGWMPGYDVYIRARQHGGCPPTSGHPCVVSEYGDWEYYAMTAGLDQESWKALAPSDSTSRQLRWQGERAMLQQATNFQEAHNENRAGAAFGDGLWLMYDYDRGYAPDVESSGCADILRVPKYSYHFFRSQRDAGEPIAGVDAGPMLFIASGWTATSATNVRVFSNCDEVELRLNGRMVDRRRPDRNRISGHLAHPPFTFEVGRFQAGTLDAVGLIGGRAVARHQVRTPGPARRLTLGVDLAGRAPSTRGQDLLFVRASLVDEEGTVVGDAWENVAFGVTETSARLVGANPFATDAGIASILLATTPATRRSRASTSLYALSILRTDGTVRIVGAAMALTGAPAPFELRYSVDGSAPTPGSPRYAAPFPAARAVRAALVVAGHVVATLDEGAPKLRMQPSVAPSTRDPFRR